MNNNNNNNNRVNRLGRSSERLLNNVTQSIEDDDFMSMSMARVPIYLQNYLFRILNRNETSFEEIINNTMNQESNYKHVLSEEGEKQLNKRMYCKVSCINDTCPIMHIEFDEQHEIIELPCKHCFDIDGINKWLKEEKAECPVCRYKLLSNESKSYYSGNADASGNAYTEETIYIVDIEYPLYANILMSRNINISEDDIHFQQALLNSLYTNQSNTNQSNDESNDESNTN